MTATSLSSHTAEPTSGRLEGLEAGRGFASLFVVLSHVAFIIAEPRFYGVTLWDGRFSKFGAGVDFFFVLSGFIITWAHWHDIGRPDRWSNYAVRRFKRIYPPYWVILLPLSLAYFLVPTAGKISQHDPLNLFFSITLLPYTEHPILGVAWTLVFEMIFYAVFSLLILRGRKWFALLILWGVAVVVANLSTRTFPYPLSFALDTVNIEFLCGVGAAALLRKWQPRTPLAILMAVGGFGLFMLLLLLPYPVEANPLAMRAGYGLSTAAGIVGLVQWERNRSFAIPAWLRLMGAASFAIYLIHGIVISTGIQIITRLFDDRIPVPVTMILLITASAVVGIAFHLLIEKPLGRRLARGRRAKLVGV